MDENNQLKNFVTGIGAMCEMVGLIRDDLVKNGFTREEACQIVSQVICSFWHQDQK